MAIDNARLYQDVCRAIETRDEVMHLVAHDLRSPLSLISLNIDVLSELLEKSGAMDLRDRARRPLRSIRRAVSRSSRLIEDLLDIAALDANRLSVDRRPADPRAIALEALEQSRPIAVDKSIDLEARLPDRLAEIEIDEDRVLQVLSNIFDNALKFTPAGGQVVLRAWETGEEVCFTVRDSGAGISEQELPHLFEPFWHVRRRSGGGTGLGLAIAKGIIEAHGGRISVTSTLGQGSTFLFALPRA